MILADYLTKPLKGKRFKIFSDIIMGYKPTSLLESITFSIKECVRNNGEMLETVFDQKHDAVLLSHKIQSKDK